MKLVLEVKTNKKAIRPSPDNVILYDGKEWYITTKQDLFKEYDERYKEKLAECDRKIEEMNAFKVSVAGQILELKDLIKVFVIKEEDK